MAVTPFASRANERFLRGELLAALGRDSAAVRWFASLGHGSVSVIPLQALAQQRAGAQRGGRARAAARCR